MPIDGEFFNLDDKTQGLERVLAAGICSRIFASERVMLSVVTLAPNAQGKPQSHPEEQWGILLEGDGVRTQGRRETVVKAGGFWRTPGGVVHGFRAGPNGTRLLDIFSPPRADYIDNGHLKAAMCRPRIAVEAASVGASETLKPDILHELSSFPARLEALYALMPDGYERWSPDTWTGVPSEPLNPIEQICHVRDVEQLGYHVRLTRILRESNPSLASLDAETMARDRNYAKANAAAVLSEFRVARARPVELIANLAPRAFERTAVLEGYGPLTLRGLVHFLCSHDNQHAAGLHWLLGRIAAATREF